MVICHLVCNKTSSTSVVDEVAYLFSERTNYKQKKKIGPSTVS